MDRIYFAAWSPCGQFIAASFGDVVQILDSNTLEIVSVLKPPCDLQGQNLYHLTFSPSGSLLAGFYFQ